jgi:hypothetical protein
MSLYVSRRRSRWRIQGREEFAHGCAALDPATTILEVAVRETFRKLDIVPHVLTSARLNPNWLRPGVVSAAQQSP